MGKQIGFYAIGEDHSALLRDAEEMGFKAIPEVIPADTDVEPSSPTDFDLADDQESFYLIPGEIGIGEAIYVNFDTEPEYDGLNGMASPVTEFSPSRREGDRVSDGRIFFGLGADDEFYGVAAKSFDRLAGTVRKWERTKDGNLYVGPYTADLARRGEIKLMQHETEVQLP